MARDKRYNMVLSTLENETKMDVRVCTLYINYLSLFLEILRLYTLFSLFFERRDENFSCWHWRHFPTAAPPANMWGGGRERLRNFQISRVELSSFLLFLGVRGASSKTIKTGLNCWQDERLYNTEIN